jgi:UDP-N-acetylglucosamine 3-dehydrogenase
VQIRIGVIGGGSIARKRHLPELADNPNVKIEAICDVSKERAEELARQYGAKPFTDYRKLIELKSLDAVIVCATNTTHAVMTIDALRAGKHVLCEKPMAVNLQDARSMISASEESGKYLMIAHNQRLSPAHIKAKEILRTGRLGKVLTFRAVFGHPGCEYWAIDKANTWFFNKSITFFGCIGDLGIHKFDLMRWMLNEEFVEVSAFAETLNKRNAKGQLIDVEDNASCILKGKSGIIGDIILSWTYQKEDNSVVLYCENGVMNIYTDPDYQIIINYSDNTSEYYKLGEIQTNTKQIKSGIVDQFINCLVENRKPEISGEEGYQALKIALACLDSAQQKKVIAI